MMDDKQFVASVMESLLQFREQGRTPNKAYLEATLKTWRRNSPKMVAELTKLGILKETAERNQYLMEDEEAGLLASGMPPTDAREQAEIAWMMFEPEEPEDQA